MIDVSVVFSPPAIVIGDVVTISKSSFSVAARSSSVLIVNGIVIVCSLSLVSLSVRLTSVSPDDPSFASVGETFLKNTTGAGSLSLMVTV